MLQFDCPASVPFPAVPEVSATGLAER